MFGYQIIEPSAGSTDWTDLSVIINNMMQGFISLSLTNYDTTDVPSIAAGSQIEVAGSLYTFASTEAITGSLSTKQNYIMLTTSSSSITASYTSDAPTWVPSKHGWYDSSTGVQRYIGGSATDFGGKWVYETGQQNRSEKTNSIVEQKELNNLKIKILEIGDWDIDATTTINVAHGLTKANIRTVMVTIRFDADGDRLPLEWNGLNDPNSGKTGGRWSLDATNVILYRFEDGVFNGAGFDSTSYNRGWITIWYEV